MECGGSILAGHAILDGQSRPNTPAGEYPEPSGHGRFSPLRRPGLQSFGTLSSGRNADPMGRADYSYRPNPPIPNRFIYSPGSPQTSSYLVTA